MPSSLVGGLIQSAISASSQQANLNEQRRQALEKEKLLQQESALALKKEERKQKQEEARLKALQQFGQSLHSFASTPGGAEQIESQVSQLVQNAAQPQQAQPQGTGLVQSGPTPQPQAQLDPNSTEAMIQAIQNTPVGEKIPDPRLLAQQQQLTQPQAQPQAQMRQAQQQAEMAQTPTPQPVVGNPRPSQVKSQRAMQQRVPYGSDPRFLAMGMQALQAGPEFKKIGEDLLKRGIGPDQLEIAQELRKDAELQIKEAKLGIAEGNFGLNVARFSNESKRLGMDMQVAQADLKLKGLNAQLKQLEIGREPLERQGMAADIANKKQELKAAIAEQEAAINFASSLAGRAANSGKPEEARRLVSAAQMAFAGKLKDAANLAYPDGQNPTRTGLAIQAEDPNLPEAQRKLADRALKRLATLTENPDGSVSGPAGALALKKHVGKLIPEQTEILAGNKAAFTVIQRAKGALLANPGGAGTLAGAAAKLYETFLDNLQIDNSASRLLSARSELKEGLAASSQSAAFYQKSLATILAVRFNGGGGRLTDEDFRRGEEEVAKKFVGVSGYTSYLRALDLIEEDLRGSTDTAVAVAAPYVDLSALKLPPPGPASSSAQLPGAGVESTPAPAPGPSELKPLEQMSTEEMLEELRRPLNPRGGGQ